MRWSIINDLVDISLQLLSVLFAGDIFSIRACRALGSDALLCCALVRSVDAKGKLAVFCVLCILKSIRAYDDFPQTQYRLYIAVEVLNAWGTLDVFFASVLTSTLQIETFAGFMVSISQNYSIRRLNSMQHDFCLNFIRLGMIATLSIRF